jgi:trehalose 6-phosphate phosphatase
MSVELRPATARDKGSATRDVAERYGLRGLLVAGDDVTDLDMFRAAAELQGAGVATAIIAVRGGSEVPVEVSDAADAVVEGPQELSEMLSALASDPDAGGAEAAAP